MAIATGDLRTISAGQLERVRAKMRAIVGRHLPATTAEITFIDRYPAMEVTAAGERLLQEFQAASIDLNLGAIHALDPGQRGAADISFVAPFIPGLAGLGAPGRGAHTPSEEVDLQQLERQTKRVALFLYRLTRDEEAIPGRTN
jgi:glutamate carboxypeptidase